MKYKIICLFGVALIGAALFYMRHLSFSFPLGTTTEQHPYIAFTAALMIANLIWVGLIFAVKKWTKSEAAETSFIAIKPKWRLWLLGMLGLSLGFRALFLGSIPVYEDDWNRYLWDGVSIVQGVDPYQYTPAEIITQVVKDQTIEGQKIISPDEREKLLALGDEGYEKLRRINNKPLTTIYPPSAQAAFAAAALIKPLDINGLRIVFLFVDALTLFLMVKALTLYGRSPLWVLIYAFNPLLIYSAFNVVHMDIVLPPFMMAALILVKRRPIWAGIALAGAAAVKVWPLILAPLLYRNWTHRPKVYVASAAMVSLASLILFWPMITQIRPDSGLSAYSQNWQRSSFLFPAALNLLEVYMDDPGRLLRLAVAGILTALSLIMGFGHMLKKAPDHIQYGGGGLSQFPDPNTIPKAMLLLTLALLFLSPTGYPWYMIWAIMFIPFAPFYGAAFLCVLVPLYYVRFALGEQNRYEVYQDLLVPIQFGVPILILLIEYCVHQLRKPETTASAKA